MSTSYNAAELANSQLYQTRFTVGDTGEDEFFLQDEEVQFIIDSNTDLQQIAILCCEAIVSRLAKRFDYKLGPAYDYISQQYDHFKERLSDLKKKVKSSNAYPIFEDPHRSIFSVDMMNVCADHTVEED